MQTIMFEQNAQSQRDIGPAPSEYILPRYCSRTQLQQQAKDQCRTQRLENHCSSVTTWTSIIKLLSQVKAM